MTQRYRIGLIGDHIGTSQSPAMHEAEAAAHGLDEFSYELIDLADRDDVADRLGEIVADYIEAGFTGFNVTHPHKQHMVAQLDDLSDAARKLGAVNNIVCTAHGLMGHNTDHSGFLAGLHHTLPAEALRHTVVLFGAGGAGAAVASALLDYGVRQLRIIDPDPAQCQRLNDQLGPTVAYDVTLTTGGEDKAQHWVPNADAVVNATPIGMEHLPGTAFNTLLLNSEQWVADVIYRPVETELLATARALGCVVVNGTAMLVEQAADTFELQTGLVADRARMRKRLQERLAAPTNEAF